MNKEILDKCVMLPSRGKRRISIKVQNGVVYVRSSPSISQERVLEFVESKEKWIMEALKRQNDIKNENEDILKYRYIFYLGNKYKVVYMEGIKNISITDNYFVIPKKYSNNVGYCLKQWCMDNFEEIVVNKTKALIERLNLKCDSITMMDSVYAWGKCCNRKEIKYNYKLLLLDMDCIDYVIVHEVCHIFEMNHSKKFWAHVGHIMPKYKETIVKMKKYGFLLKLLD